MRKIIVSDTSCVVLLDKIGNLDLLKSFFGKITITPEVAEEFGKPLQDWIRVENCPHHSYKRVLQSALGKGEASAIALCLDQYETGLVILDDLKARRFALELGLNITGTIGILIAAKQNGLIKSVKPILQQIMETNFRISEELVKYILLSVNEKLNP
ncbi:MAG: DUF3368 domain-containing protein [Bacteroidetes bacterium]|nr:DUF3368 domain-containing protein [Bacteroidota bacterium]